MIILGVTAFIAIVGLIVTYVMVISEGYPMNPLKWAQERRRRNRRASLVRISALEHELGYRPCSIEECRDCKHWEIDQRIKKSSALGTKYGGFSKNDELLSRGMLDYDIDMYYDYGKQLVGGIRRLPPSTPPDRIKK